MLAAAEWHPNVGDAASDAMEKAHSTEPVAVARALEGMSFDGKGLGGAHTGQMRASDHQFLQPLYVSMMDRAGRDGVRFDVEGTGYGFRSVRRFDASALAPATTCHMVRPD